MTYRLLDTVVLDRDLPDHALRRGDLGAVIEVYEPDGLEVEFVTASGRTAALVTLTAGDVRAPWLAHYSLPSEEHQSWLRTCASA
jgi:hypothetical protein